ncbi:MAG: hypothetical protein WDW38_001727 [Sanguina aurantia]
MALNRLQSPLSMDGMSVDYSQPLTSSGLIVEVAGGTFCFKNQIKPITVKQLWAKLSTFISVTLKGQKGVLLPNLGTFRVGPVMGETKKKIRPAFSLLEGRYGGVSQERAKYTVGGRPAIVQPNYGLLSTVAGVPRGATQRLLGELLQRLGVHILSGRSVKVDFPSLGCLQTNRAGRLEFTFDPLLNEFFEHERHQVIPEMELYDADTAAEEPTAQLSSQMENLRTSNRAGANASRPASAGVQPGRNGAANAKQQQQPPAAYRGNLMELFRLCTTSDKIASGCVPRLQLEQWLHSTCSSLLSQVDGATVLELLTLYTYGKNARHILYKPFLDALEMASNKGGSPQTNSARPAVANRPAVNHGQQQPPAGPGQYGRQQQQQQESDHSEPGQDHEEAEEDGGDEDIQRWVLPCPFFGLQPMFARPRVDIPPPPSTAGGGGGGMDGAMHYHQQELPTGSRSEFDTFNRMHFEALRSSRGPDPRKALTPKVGWEPLNQQARVASRAVMSAGEYQAVRVSHSSAGTPGGYFGAQQEERARASDTPRSTRPQAFALPQPTSPSARSNSTYRPIQRPTNESHRHESQGQQQQYSHQQQQQQQHGQLQPAYSTQHDQDEWERKSVAGAGQEHQQQQQQRQGGPGAPVMGVSPVAAGAPYANTMSASRGHTSGSNAGGQQQLQTRQSQQAWQSQAGLVSVSQYDIINERDPVVRGRMRADLASELSTGWKEQIREKDRMEQAVIEAGSQWPFGPSHTANDKRPTTASSRPPSAGRTKGHR